MTEQHNATMEEVRSLIDNVQTKQNILFGLGAVGIGVSTGSASFVSFGVLLGVWETAKALANFALSGDQ